MKRLFSAIISQSTQLFSKVFGSKKREGKEIDNKSLDGGDKGLGGDAKWVSGYPILQKDNRRLCLYELRANQNPTIYSLYWQEANLLSKGAKARLLNSCLDSVCLRLLGHNNLLYRAVINSYNRCIEPSHELINKMSQSIVYSQKKADVIEPTLCDKLPSPSCQSEKQHQQHLKP